MRVDIGYTGESITTTDNSTVLYGKCLPIWENISSIVTLSLMPGNTTKIAIRTLINATLSGEVATLEPVNGVKFDLSSLYPLFDRVTASMKDLRVWIQVTSGSVLSTIHIPVMNAAMPNLLQVKAKNGTDFLDNVSPRAPLAHSVTDAFYLDTTKASTYLSVAYRTLTGQGQVVSKRQGEPFSTVNVVSADVNFTGESTTRFTKIYPNIEPACGALTFRWLNSCGSFDFISCYNWTFQETLAQGTDGGQVTKKELSCVFELTPANAIALQVLSKSPLVGVVGINDNVTMISARCTSTTGPKQTGGGMTKTVTLKFNIA